ncbi:MAG: DUF4382 domain-containing protein [Bacillota bacterium]
MSKTLLVLPLSLFGFLAGCGGGSSNGRLDIALTDTPTDQASSVVVEFTGVKFQPTGGNVISYTFPAAQQIDLTQLQSGITTPLLANFSLPAGHYDWLELEVSATPGAKDSYLILNSGGTHGLVLTATGQAGLRTSNGFDVVADDGSTLVVDFDARRSVLSPVGASTDYQLQPSIRMLDARAGGNIIGSVPGGLAAAANCVPVVYVYAGNVSAPTDINASAPAATQPVTEEPVLLDTAFGAYRFTAAYLPAGTYTLAFTCDASKDDPAKADSIGFNPVGTVKATAGQTILAQL